MNRWLSFAICAVGGMLMLALGLLVPVHLRAVDSDVIMRAGAHSSGLVDTGLSLVRERKLGAAQLLLRAAPDNVPDREKLRAAVNKLAADQPAMSIYGGDTSLHIDPLFVSDPQPINTNFQSLTEFVIHLENRDVVLGFLRASRDTAVQELLRCRALTNTVIFSPSMSDAGQAFDAAVSVTGLLLEENRLTSHLHDQIFAFAQNANRGAGSEPLEQALADMMSLGQRFNWGQLAAFVSHVEDTDTLHQLTEEARHETTLPALFSAVVLTGRPTQVAQFLTDFPQTGYSNLAASIREGAGGVRELVIRDERLSHASDFGRNVASYPVVNLWYRFTLERAVWTPWVAFTIKWFCYLCGGFLLAGSMHFAKPPPSELEQPLQVRGFQFVRETFFAAGFLVVVLLLSEPFLGAESQKAPPKMEVPLHVHLPVLGHPVSERFIQQHPHIMNQISLLTLLVFFVLQSLLYLGSVTKLAEIRRQKVAARIKLRLLDNEEHLFDAGLYLGFVGTIISLILASLQIFQLGLMAGYSSTSFGIIFVFIFKIFQLRPERRRLVLEAEADQANPAVAPAPATPALAPIR